MVRLVLLTANVAASTYWNMVVEGQGFGQALWGGATEGSTAGDVFAAATNYDLTTFTYQGMAWDERLEMVADAAAQLAAARVGTC